LACRAFLIRDLHLQSGHGLDDIGLAAIGARSVVGVDFSEVAATAAQRRAKELAAACRYVVAEVPGVPLRGECADLVYAGKGALIWMRDLAAWARARDAARLLRPTGHLFVHEAHPTVPLWTRQGEQHCRSELAAGDFPGLSVPVAATRTRPRCTAVTSTARRTRPRRNAGSPPA